MGRDVRKEDVVFVFFFFVFFENNTRNSVTTGTNLPVQYGHGSAYFDVDIVLLGADMGGPFVSITATLPHNIHGSPLLLFKV
jgi:hypothetical protein